MKLLLKLGNAGVISRMGIEEAVAVAVARWLVITGKMKNAQKSLIKQRFNCNVLFIVRSYHNNQHHAII